MDAVTTYRLFAANADRALERISTSPQVSRDVEYYRENIGSVKTAEELVSDPRLLNFALRAYGLEDLSYARALIQKVLEEGTDDKEALANKLTDPRYKELVEVFNFNKFSEATTSFDRAQQGVIDRYYQQTLELEAGQQNTGARLAIYFERKAAEIETPLELLADKALIQVVRTALAIPEQTGLLDLDRQSELISSRLDIEDLKDPEFVRDFTNRFLALWDLNNPANVSVPPLISPSGPQSLSLSLISTIQTFRRS
ncbi:MAG: DUF1217 domain-containing protein [Pseudomonadota bacterium]